MSLEDIFRTNWHAVSAREAANILESDLERGLSEQTVARRREFFGYNKLPEEKPPSKILIFSKQFKNPFIIILVAAGLVTLFFREYTDTIVIFGTVLINTVIGYAQENRATNALAKLKQILKHKAWVVRAAQEKEIPQQDVVPGDILVLNPGSKVPADGRLLSSWNLRVNEAVLTGEWIAASKKNTVLDEKTPLADRDNMVYMGSVVEEGNGKAAVTAIGLQTELGKISSLVSSVQETRTPYQEKLARFSWLIGIGVSLLAAIIFLQGILLGEELFHMFELAVAIAVSAIPEGLPIAMTVVLAIGMQRILKAKGLVRSLPAAETLGSTTVIATDKTLTLTEGKMQVEEIVPLRFADREQTLLAGMLANEAFVENPAEMLEKQIIRGRPTDRALLQAGMEAGLSKTKLEENLPVILRIPFESATRYVASFHRTPEGANLYVSGAPETLLSLSQVSKDEKAQALATLAELTQKGLRVVSCATRQIPQDQLAGKSQEQLSHFFKSQIKDLTFIGFVALKDPIRKGVKEAIEAAKGAGIQTVIVTGDHALTARAIAAELGLPAQHDNIMEGRHLDALGERELQKLLPKISVFARVEPSHKLRIIEAWQEKGAIIAMTGDGVNDAPALKKANIGLALGSGTDVAKETADLVLLGDNFSIIPAAIKEGRVILDNIRKIITFMVSGTFTETILIGSTLVLGAPFLPVTALQILWINLVEGTFPSIALTLEKAEKDIMRRRPPKPNTSLLTGEMKTLIFVISVITDFLLIGLFYWLLGNSTYSPQHIQTVLFVGLGIDSLLYVFSCKSLRKNIWQYNPFSNLWLVASVLFSFILLFAVIYIPLLQRLFETRPLNLFDWTLLAALGIINIVLIEAGKWVFIQRDKKADSNGEI
ncbi:MAG TPA: HAD-IC family P-type ATPase [Candidatus Paceibacterota bacterium]|nr:HAD-IC family P-type ATPase [Candidatus Paceibacterota bacterium]